MLAVSEIHPSMTFCTVVSILQGSTVVTIRTIRQHIGFLDPLRVICIDGICRIPDSTTVVAIFIIRSEKYKIAILIPPCIVGIVAIFLFFDTKRQFWYLLQ